ncbi:MAG: hypothetical protein J6B85_01965 [Lachnospiraceae bacterium]|nr:hypothetical protein [Lachnospiraceae bacterium]
MEEKKEIKITIQRQGKSELDYSRSLEELKEIHKERMERIKAGEKQLATLEFAMLAYAIDCVNWVKKSFSIDLDLEEGSLLQFQNVLENAQAAIKKGALPKERIDSFLKLFGGYYGALILHNLGGEWVQSSIGPAVEIGTRHAFVMTCIVKFLNSGAEDESCIGFYGRFKDACSK